MNHKAFEFDWERFNVELWPILKSALHLNEITELRSFVWSKLDGLKDPYEGNPLKDNWETTLEKRDVQEYGDFALTLYYDPSKDCGITNWIEISDLVTEPFRAALLGFPIGSSSTAFDPGRMGSYFMDEETVQSSLSMLSDFEFDQIQKFKDLLKRSMETGSGVYVTF